MLRRLLNKIRMRRFINSEKHKIFLEGSLLNAFYKSKTVFIHIPKTAGTSLVKSIYGDVSAEGHRNMLFYKWYGKNLDESIPEFNQSFNYIKTIGVSLFREKTSTSRHFGPMRLTYRILYNFNKVKNTGSYIEADGINNIWKKSPLFIFDDTLIHQSFNEEDDIRYCAFIDIVRPSHLNHIMIFLLSAVGFLLKKTRGIFYKNWKMI